MTNSLDTSNQEDSSVEEETLDAEELLDAQEDDYALPLGDELKIDQISQLSSAEGAQLVLFVGETGCGKTTLLTSIYQYFLNAIPEAFYFAGSKTLNAFEERSFYTRNQSNQNNPDMKRTSVGSLDSFLHLKIFDTSTEATKNFIISDFSGEDYNRVNSSVESVTEDFAIIKQVKNICLLLDGEKILDKFAREGEVNKAKKLLRTFKDASLLNNFVKISIIICKYDLVYQSLADDSSLKLFISRIPAKLKELFEKVDMEIKLLEVAAMPKESTDEIKKFYGIEELLDNLFSKTVTSIQDHPPTIIQVNSQFDLFESNYYAK